MPENMNLPQISRCVGKAIDEIKGEVTKQDIWSECMNADLGVTETQIKGALIWGEISDQFRSRSREKLSRKTDQGDLWSGGYLDSLMIAGNTACKVRHATWQWHEEKRENQIVSMRKANSRFERDEQRREEIADLMRKDSSMTTEEALRQLGINAA